MEKLLAIYLIACCGLWCVLYLYAMLVWNRIPQLEQLQATPLKTWPRVSIVMPACNEADTIKDAVAKLLLQDYPALEIILVDDRSQDDTGKIINQLAGSDPRVKAVHIRDLPADWLGKVHALHTGTRHASGEWLLYSDADIHYGRKLLRKVISYAEQNRLDHVSLIPKVISDNWLLQTITRAFGIIFMVGARATAVEDPNKAAAIGVGAFNLVRRSAFEQTPGFEWLCMEAVDDVSLALMMKRHGFRTRFALAYEDLSVVWYHSIRAMAQGFEKNITGPVSHYRMDRLFIVSCISTAIVLAPYVSLLMWQSPLVWPGIAWLAVNALLGIRVAIADRDNPLPWLLVPLGILVFHLIFLRAALLLVKRQGIIWRGTKYPIEKLQQYQRFKL
jgi:glycosyltransferase involved in cell wall biosynthesis